MVAHLFIQVTISGFLQDRPQLPAMGTMEFLCFQNRRLSVSPSPMLRQDEQRRNALWAIVSGIYHPERTNGFAVHLNPVKVAVRLLELPCDAFYSFIRWICILILIPLRKFCKDLFLHFPD